MIKQIKKLKFKKYSRVHISSDKVFFKILKKPPIEKKIFRILK